MIHHSNVDIFSYNNNPKHTTSSSQNYMTNQNVISIQDRCYLCFLFLLIASLAAGVSTLSLMDRTKAYVGGFFLFLFCLLLLCACGCFTPFYVSFSSYSYFHPIHSSTLWHNNTNTPYYWFNFYSLTSVYIPQQHKIENNGSDMNDNCTNISNNDDEDENQIIDEVHNKSLKNSHPSKTI